MMPMAVGATINGILLAVLTKWGLTRFWWVLVKLVVSVVLTGGGTFALHEQVQRAVDASAAGGVPAEGSWIVGANVANLVALATLVLISIVKPWGRTPWGEGALSQDTRSAISQRCCCAPTGSRHNRCRPWCSSILARGTDAVRFADDFMAAIHCERNERPSRKGWLRTCGIVHLKRQ